MSVRMLAHPSGKVNSRVSGLKGCPDRSLRISRVVEKSAGCKVKPRLKPIERFCDASTESN
jgi:hypothetical protein